MKKIFQSATSLVLALALISAPVVDAQTRGRQGRSTSQTTQQKPTQSSGATNYRNQGSNASSNRPAGSGATNNNNRPATPGNTSNNRPATPGNSASRPSTPGNASRPSAPGGAPAANRPPAGGPGYSSPTPPRQPARPVRHDVGYRHPVPFFNGFNRPLPPTNWRYVSGGPVFTSILGLALGTALGVSLASLANSGYSVSSYGNDVVYLNNVPQMNYNWPDAALYYNNGVLCGSQFTYPTSYYDMGRYNALYNVFVNQYGHPVSYSNTGGVVCSNWFGPDGRYVTLSFSSVGGRYYTTLSFGN